MADIELIRGKTVLGTQYAMDPEGKRFEAEIIYGDDYSGWFRPVGEEDMSKWYSLNKEQYQDKLAKYMAKQEKLARIDAELGLDNIGMDTPMYSTAHNGDRADVSTKSAGPARQQDGYMLAAGGSRDKDSGSSGREKEKRGNKAGGEGNGKKKGLSGTAKAGIAILIVLAVILCILKAVSNMVSSGSSSSGQESQTEAEADPDATYSVAVWACSKSAGDTVEEGDFQTVSFSGTVYASLLEGGTPLLEEDIEGLYGLTLASDVTEGSTAYSSQINAAESADGTMTIKIYADITYSDGTVEEGVLIGEYSAEGGTDIEAYAEVTGGSADDGSDTEEDDDTGDNDGSDAAEGDDEDDETSEGVGEIELN